VTCKKAVEVRCHLGEQGCRAIEEIDKEFEGYIRSAELGDARAHYDLGLFYFNGLGVSVDKVEAVKWYRIAAKQGFTNAYCNMDGSYL
jgi:TPR repeat protein